MTEIDYGFLKKYSEYIELYKENRLPVIICDSELNAGWGNPAAETLYPHLVEEKGFGLLLGEFDKQELIKKMKAEGSVLLSNLIGLSDIILTLTPIIKSGALYGAVAELMGANAVILPPKSMISSQTPMRISGSIRESVKGIFRAMDIATQMEHLLLEKAELKKHGLDLGFISASFDSVSKYGYYLLRMSENLMAYSELNASPIEPRFVSADVFRLLSKSEGAVKLLAEDMGIPVEFSLPDEDGTVGLDAEKFEHAFFNILSNALYFTRNGNYVTITGKVLKDTVSVMVSDRGTGIPKDVLPHIFEPYYAYGHALGIAGIGLGLTVAKSLVEAHNGKISVKSKIAEGTSVTVTIPRGIFARRPTAMRADDKNASADRFSHLYVGLVDAKRSPFNSRNKD